MTAAIGSEEWNRREAGSELLWTAAAESVGA